MGLSAERDLRTIEQNPSLPKIRLCHGDAVVQVLLPPGPTTVQQVSIGVPYHGLQATHACIRIGAEGRSPIEEHADFAWHSIGHSLPLVHLPPHHRTANIPLTRSHRPHLS